MSHPHMVFFPQWASEAVLLIPIHIPPPFDPSNDHCWNFRFFVNFLKKRYSA